MRYRKLGVLSIIEFYETLRNFRGFGYRRPVWQIRDILSLKNRVLWARIFYFKTPLDNNTGFNNYILYGFLFDIQDTLSYIIFNNNSLSFASPATR